VNSFIVGALGSQTNKRLHASVITFFHFCSFESTTACQRITDDISLKRQTHASDIRLLLK